MNNKTKYEQTIAAKLEALPLPDMADAIWARIETQLDLELPTDDGPGGGDAPNFPGGGFLLGGISLIVVAVLYFLFSQPNNNTNPTLNRPEQNTPVSTQPNAIPSTAPPDVSRQNANAATGAFSTQATSVPQTPFADSALTGILPPALLPDSAITSPVLPQVITAAPPIQKDTTPPAKKGRGVSGISDDDYRIVPKKDSSKNNNP